MSLYSLMLDFQKFGALVLKYLLFEQTFIEAGFTYTNRKDVANTLEYHEITLLKILCV